MSIEVIKQALEALENNRWTHYYCEDTWYSCPKHEEGCANDSEGDECNCGADKANAEIEAAIASLRQAIDQAEKQEPVGWLHWLTVDGERFPQLTLMPRTDKDEPLYTAPPRKEWGGLTDDEVFDLADENLYNGGKNYGILSFYKAIEANLREKNQ